MAQHFDSVITDPQNLIFHVVFFPDRIYHAEYLNATRSPRYRYNVQEVRGKADMNILKGQVFLDRTRTADFLRVEYRAGRLTEAVRERGRFVQSNVIARIGILPPGLDDSESNYVFTFLRLNYCPWIGAYQAELWSELEPPAGTNHDWQVLDQMGFDGSITASPVLAPYLADTRNIRRVRLSLRESLFAEPSGYPVMNPAWDNSYQRNVQVPITPQPSSPRNTVFEGSYTIDFQRGWFIRDISAIQPVRYRDAMMDQKHRLADKDQNNIVDMRWVLQQELGGSLVFFHEVHLRPGVVEGTHQHVGSEELYYITEGEGTAFMSINDDPGLPEQLRAMGVSDQPVEQDVFGVGVKMCYPVPVKKGSVIFTKSGGIHGIRNNGPSDLRFVAFLYHSS